MSTSGNFTGPKPKITRPAVRHRHREPSVHAYWQGTGESLIEDLTTVVHWLGNAAERGLDAAGRTYNRLRLNRTARAAGALLVPRPDATGLFPVKTQMAGQPQYLAASAVTSEALAALPNPQPNSQAQAGYAGLEAEKSGLLRGPGGL